ncbi:hypothetical protein NDU88_004455 [Pleurodeles waltl]|uniref:Uncharacterized protein n=1 Tax=Pleurodeles waltl TaxID=8319 RepID=A0AAV7M7W4_PLEWA|nr:hypothetical protein NDU88_004455 [Pleurodeles waltl]
MTSPQRPTAPMASSYRPATLMTSPYQSMPITELQVSTAPMGSAPVPDGSRLDLSVSPSSLGMRLSVLKRVLSTLANSTLTPRLEARLQSSGKALRPVFILFDAKLR